MHWWGRSGGGGGAAFGGSSNAPVLRGDESCAGPTGIRTPERVLTGVAPLPRPVVTWHAWPVKHGGQVTTTVGCRRDVCATVHREHQREMRAKRATRTPELDQLLWHGTVSTYKNHRCRCEACSEAGAEANRRRPSRARPAR